MPLTSCNSVGAVPLTSCIFDSSATFLRMLDRIGWRVAREDNHKGP